MKFKVVKNGEPILSNSIHAMNPLKWDSLWAYHPCVIEHKGLYYMIYTGKSLKPGIAHNIGLATSSDLKSWKKERHSILELGNSGAWDNDFIAHAYVFKEGSKFYMLYDGSRKGKWLEEIGLAESDDLRNWKKYRKNPIFKVGSLWWEKSHVSRCCVFKEKDKYYLYYAGNDGRSERIGLATGKNITSLKRYSEEPILNHGNSGEWDEKSVSDPRVIKSNKSYYMFYTGVSRNGIERIGVAISDNLYSWKKYSGNPILDVSLDLWDSISAGRGEIKLINNQLYIFYSGKKKHTYSIGSAEISIL